MGKGDKRSFKGKLFKGSYGKTRPRHPAPKAAGAGTTTTAAAGANARKK
jgi:ribosomal small subunit protein bTHX